MKKWEESKFFNISNIVYNENQGSFLDLVPENPYAKLLDIGCNNGEFTMKIANKIKTNAIYGVEISNDSAVVAQDKGVKVKISDLNKSLPFDDCCFDIVTANQVIEHLYSTDIFKEVYRVLKMGG